MSLLAASLALAPAVHADEAAYRACVGKARADATALARCGADRIEAADKAMEAALTSALADMPGDAARKALTEEQGAWTAFRDRSCRMFASGDFPREVEAVSFAVCRAGVIETRASYLKGLTDN